MSSRIAHEEAIRAGRHRDRPVVAPANPCLSQFAPIATALDAAHGSSAYGEALAAARAALADPELLPSARALATMKRDFAGSHVDFMRAQSEQTRNHLLGLPWGPEQQAAFEAMARVSLAEQVAIEGADTQDFETWRQAYLAPEGLRV